MRDSKVHALRTERMGCKLRSAVLYMSSLVYQAKDRLVNLDTAHNSELCKSQLVRQTQRQPRVL